MVELTQGEPNGWLRKAAMAAAAILVCEYLLLTWTVDTTPIQQRIGWLAGIEYLGPLVIAIGAAVLVFALTRKANVILSTAAPAATARRAPPYVAAHGLARSIVLVPFAEELAFRGYLLRRLTSADFTDVSPARWNLTSLLVSSLAFGVLQSNWIAGAIAGILYAYAQHRRGRIEDAFLAHAVNAVLASAYELGFALLRHS